MKQLIFAAATLIYLAQTANGQDSLHNNISAPEKKYKKPGFFSNKDKEYDLQKSSNLRSAAWVLLAAGPVLAISGYFVDRNKPENALDNFGSTVDAAGGSTILIFAGAACISIGIPLLIRSAHYRKKAMSASAFLQMEKYQPLLKQVSL